MKEIEFQEVGNITESFSEIIYNPEQLDLESKANRFNPEKQNPTPTFSMPAQIGIVSQCEQEGTEINKGRLS